MTKLRWYHPWLLLARLLHYLPGPVLDVFIGLTGKVLDLVLYKTARQGLALAFPAKSPSERNRIASRAAQNMIAGAISIVRLNRMKFTLENKDVIQQCYDPDHGLLIASLHMGPPEAAALQLQQLGYPVAVLIGAGKRSPRFNAFGRHILGWYGLQPLLRGNPLLLMKSLRQGHCITFHNDMRARDAEVHFFGRKVRAPASVISLALAQQQPLLFHYATPNGKNSWKLHFEAFELESTGDRDHDTQQNLQRLMDRMESVIRQYPEHWIWHYDRFSLKKAARKNRR
ncbi:lysophospholipid acyltransferase family protein [Endozoicomonadaceae bacterium StTr2]